MTTRQKTGKNSQLTYTINTITYTNTTSCVFTEPDGPCGNQHYSHKLLMMGIEVPKTC